RLFASICSAVSCVSLSCLLTVWCRQSLHSSSAVTIMGVVQPALAIPAIVTQHALSSARSLDLLSDFRVPFIGGLAQFDRVRDDPLGALVALPRVIDAQRDQPDQRRGHDAAAH